MSKYQAIELKRGEARTVNGKRHSTISKGEVRIVSPDGTGLLTMARHDQSALDMARTIADSLNTPK